MCHSHTTCSKHTGHFNEQMIQLWRIIIKDTYNHIFTKENIVESGFSHIHYILNTEHGDLCFKFTNLQPNIYNLLNANTSH